MNGASISFYYYYCGNYYYGLDSDAVHQETRGWFEAFLNALLQSMRNATDWLPRTLQAEATRPAFFDVKKAKSKACQVFEDLYER